jgi:hypothetical protein
MFSPTVLTIEISEPSQPTERQNTALYSADYEVIIMIFQYDKIVTYYRTKTITYVFE